LIRILHVEDSSDFREMTRARLLDLAQDICIAEASTAEEALILLKRDKYDCVISDYQLPGMAGLDLLGALRKRRSQIPFIMLTGFEDCRLEQEARAAGVGDFRVKSGAQTDFAGLLKSIRKLSEKGAEEPQDSVQEVADSEALKEAIHSIFERSTVGFYRTTPSGRIVMANPALVRMLGYSSLEDLQQLNLEGDGWTADYDRKAIKKKLNEEGGIAGLEIRWLRKDGTPIYLRENSSALRDERGDVIYYQGTLEDITEKKRAEQDLQAQTHFLQQLLDAIPIPVFSKDIKLGYSTCNKAFTEILGLSREEIIGKTVSQTTADPDRAAFFDAKDRQLLVRPCSQVYEAQVLHTDGSARDAVFHKASFLDEQGNTAGIVGAIFDITERKRMEEELKRSVEQLETRTHQLNASNMELEAFAHTISHDLQAPLRRISGWIEIILSEFDEELPDKTKEYLGRIDHNSREMSTLVEAILNFSRVMVAQIITSEVDLEALARRLFAELQSDQPHRKVEFRLGKDMNCKGDPVLLKVLVKNLLSNAWKYTGATESTVIEFGSTEQDGKTVFYVKDNGIGFDQDKAGLLFTPFQRLHTGTAFEGSGIGLATAQRIVHRHGGSIWAEGTPGGGATFYFTLS
jgi:PAS domain S-box-containing protein